MPRNRTPNFHPKLSQNQYQMEGAGSRMGRASSRFGPVSSSPMFTGPVRKWKRQWVFCSRQIQDNNKKTTDTSLLLLLPRWTPLSSDSVNQPKRKFRYAPVVELKQKKSEANKEADVKSKAGDETQFSVGDTQNSNDVFEKLNVDDGVMKVQGMNKEMFPSTKKNRKMDLFGKSHTEDGHMSG